MGTTPDLECWKWMILYSTTPLMWDWHLLSLIAYLPRSVFLLNDFLMILITYKIGTLDFLFSTQAYSYHTGDINATSKFIFFFWNGLLIKSCPKNLGKPSYFTFTVVQYLISMQWACIQGIFYEITLPNTCYVRLTWREERDNASLCKLIATHVLLPGYDQHQSPQLPLRQYLPKIVTEPEIYLKWYFMIKLYKILCYSQQFTKKC